MPLNTSNGNSYGANPQGDYEGSFEKLAKYYVVIQKQLILVSNKNRFYKALGPFVKKAKTISESLDLDLRKEAAILKLVSSLNPALE